MMADAPFVPSEHRETQALLQSMIDELRNIRGCLLHQNDRIEAMAGTIAAQNVPNKQPVSDAVYSVVPRYPLHGS
jgi:hypothetical protein